MFVPSSTHLHRFRTESGLLHCFIFILVGRARFRMGQLSIFQRIDLTTQRHGAHQENIPTHIRQE